MTYILLEFAVIAARQSWFPNFRGTWLNNDTFLNADVLAYFFSNDNIKLVACTVSLCEQKIKCYSFVIQFL